MARPSKAEHKQALSADVAALPAETSLGAHLYGAMRTVRNSDGVFNSEEPCGCFCAELRTMLLDAFARIERLEILLEDHIK